MEEDFDGDNNDCIDYGGVEEDIDDDDNDDDGGGDNDMYSRSRRDDGLPCRSHP